MSFFGIIKKCAIVLHFRLLILACDGLWKVFSASEVVQRVWDAYAPIQNGETAEIVAALDLIGAKLAEEAILGRKCNDNVSIFIIAITN